MLRLCWIAIAYVIDTTICLGFFILFGKLFLLLPRPPINGIVILSDVFIWNHFHGQTRCEQALQEEKRKKSLLKQSLIPCAVH